MNKFEFTSRPSKTIFGTNRFNDFLEEISDHYRVMVFAGSRMKRQTDLISSKFITLVFSEIIQHVPKKLVDQAFVKCKEFKPDILLAIGGGSAIGLAKAIALKTSLPIAAIPSTFSGSEQTAIWGISGENGKTTGKDNRVLPKYVLYDTNFTVSMPRELTVKSAMNAMAHLMEAVYAPDGNPLTRNLSLFGMSLLKNGLSQLSQLKKDGDLHKIHDQLLVGAYLAGKCLGEVSMSLHHKTAHVLGGSFGLDHSSVHTVLQSYVLEYQWPYLSKNLQNDFKSALGISPSETLRRIALDGGVPIDLKSIGFKKENINLTIEIILSNPYTNVAPLEESRLKNMLIDAYNGKKS